MSARRTTTRVSLAALALLPALLAGAGPAAADPPAGDDRCRILLADAASWPGGTTPGHRSFSDAHELYLLSQPACSDR